MQWRLWHASSRALVFTPRLLSTLLSSEAARSTCQPVVTGARGTPWAAWQCGRGLASTTSSTMAAATPDTSKLPVVSFWERNVPYASMAVTKLAGAAVEHKTDPKGTKDTVVTLTFPSG